MPTQEETVPSAYEVKPPKYRPKHQKKGRSLYIGMAIALFSVGLWQLGFWQSLERITYNTLFQLRNAVFSPPAWDSRIAVVAIDDATLEQKGQFPLPRHYYTQLLEALNTALPAAIGFDILFSEATPDDAALAQAIANSWNVVLAIAANPQGKPIQPLPQLADSAATQGHVAVIPEPDGVSREIPLYQGNVPAFGLAVLKTYAESMQATAGQTPISSARELEQYLNIDAFAATLGDTAYVNWLNATPQLPPHNQPIDANSAILAESCTTPPQSGELAVYSLHCVLAGQVTAQAFTNKIVLIGVTATGVDALQTPFNQAPPTSNVVLHATLIDNLLNDRLLQRLPQGAEGLLLAGVTIGTTLLLMPQGPRSRLAIALGLPIVWLVTALLCLQLHWWIPVAAPISTIVLAAVCIQLREQYEKQELMDLFAMHVAPEMAKLIWQQKAEIFQRGKLQARELIVTVLFVDIRGFTTISEKLPSDQLVEWLNRYFNAMTECITAYGGVVDKYIGDEIMAVFGFSNQTGAIQEVQRAATNAIAASLAMRQRLHQLNQQFAAEGSPTLEFGIGVHTGLVTAGSIGGSRRLNYSVIGDTVNVAARLESINKVVLDNNPHKILITSATLAYVGDRYLTREVGTVCLEGRERKISVYCILGDRV